MSKYDGLAEFLSRKTSSVTVSFEEIASVVAGGLPPSAYRYTAWWANNPSRHVHARVWLDAGWATSATNLVSRKVTFDPR
jgi:hypothetical protein